MAKLKLFGNKKSKKKDKKDSNSGELKKNPKEMYSISSDMVKIKVYSTFGGNVNQLKVEFTAKEKTNESGGIVFENEKFKFIKDIDFNESDVYKNIQLLLDLNTKTHEKKIEILEEKIKYQEKLVGYLNKFRKLNAIRNYADEKLKLDDYQVLLDHIKKNGNDGAFFTIEEGMRVYYFAKEDGAYIPLWWSKNTNSQNPNNVTNNRTFIVENKIFDEEMSERMKQRIQLNSLITLVVVFVILISVELFAGMVLVEKFKEADMIVHGDAMKCAEETARTNQNMVNFINTECVDKLIDDRQQEILNKTVDPNAPIPLTT